MSAANAPPSQGSVMALAAARRLVLLKTVSVGGGQPYAIVDVSIDERLYDLLQAEPAASHVACIYDGDPAIRYARYAPYLMQVHDGSPLLQRWLEQGWHAHWGIFLTSSLAPVALKRHLKRFLKTTDQRGRTLWMRFYDPRVLPGLLANWEPGHLNDWFGGNAITACLAPMPEGLWHGTRRHGGVLDRALGAAYLESQVLEISPS